MTLVRFAALVPIAMSAVGLVVLSCSSSGESAGPADAGGAICPYAIPVAAARAGAVTSEDCASCLNAECSAALVAYASQDGCGAYVACACPGGAAASPSTVSACETQGLASGCAQATTDVDVCADTVCSAACSPATGGSGADGGDASTPGTGGSFLDASLSVTCARYATCCELAMADAGPAATEETDCEESASLLSDAQCEAYLVAYQDAGLACAP